MKTSFIFTAFVLIFAVSLLFAVVSDPELPRKRSIYELGQPLPTRQLPEFSEPRGKVCEMCSFTNYETNFRVTTDSKNCISSISWEIVNDYEKGPVKSEWNSLVKRYQHLIISGDQETVVIFRSGKTEMKIEFEPTTGDYRILVSIQGLD